MKNYFFSKLSGVKSKNGDKIIFQGHFLYPLFLYSQHLIRLIEYVIQLYRNVYKYFNLRVLVADVFFNEVY